MKLLRILSVFSSPIALSLCAAAQSSFVNWESSHVHPLDLTPDGTRLLAVNTADDRLEVFDITGPSIVLVNEIAVGVDPVSVRAHGNREAWVVNVISHSVSIVNLATGNVVTSLNTENEPGDVIFAGVPERAFVSCGQTSHVLVFDPANLGAAPIVVNIDGDQPRALARSLDGNSVYVAIFESGNSSTTLGGGTAGMNLAFPPNVVSNVTGPYGGVNPPPNAGTSFNPPIAAGLPTPPKVGLIVKKNRAGNWMDDNAHDWTALVSGASAASSGRPVGWDVTDNDIARIDVASLSVTYTRHLMNICMALAVNPVTGVVTLVGTDGTNEIRFEPNVQGRFLRVELARVTAAGSTIAVGDLNTHLNYQNSTIPQSERDKSLGDPRGIVWNAAGSKGYVSGMGSNNVIVIDPSGARAGLAPTIPVGEGPTGVALDEARSRLYVLDKFAGAISVVDTASEVESARVAFFDPSPNAIKIGRKHLYDTHKNSGLGQIACGSCHVDAKMDRLAWDLGNPAGAMKAVAGQNLGAGVPGLNIGFQDFHPMKGPMTTQTLQDIIGKEPLHWRGDRNGLEEFAPAFQGLQGDDTTLTPAEMQQFEDFLATISFTPNPYRNFDNTLPTSVDLAGHYTTGRFAAAGLPLGLNNQGNAQAGLTAYTTLLLDTGALRCVTCHTLPTGMGTDYTLQGAQLVPIPAGPNGEHHHMLVSRDGETNVSMKVPQTRNIFRKVGFNATQMINRTGFGYIHDGSVDSIERFVSEPVFTVTSDQQVADLTAFMLSFSGSDLPQGSPTNFLEPPGGTSNDTHAAVGTQTTIVDPATSSPAQFVLIANMLTIADTGKVGLIVKGRQGGLARGYAYAGSGLFRSDRAAETISWSALELAAAPGSELTWTVVPKGTEIRSGIDRDLDGAYDQDELDAGSNPADPLSLPAPAGFAFCAGDGLDPLVTTACPCNNFGASGRGCANSANASGAVLSASGVASLDTIVMHAAGMPATATAIYLQGDVDTASGIVFGDGVRCVSGALIRLGIEASNAGASQYPGLGDASIRVRSAALGDPLSNGSTRYYQTYYRDGVPSFCPSPLGNSWNVTNGVRIVW